MEKTEILSHVEGVEMDTDLVINRLCRHQNAIGFMADRCGDAQLSAALDTVSEDIALTVEILQYIERCSNKDSFSISEETQPS